MATKTLQLNMDTPGYATGWYRDPVTGQYYYYDAQADQWYIYAAGYLYPTTWSPAPKTVTVAPGDTLRIVVGFYYVGPAFDGRLYGAIGQKAVTAFDEILNNLTPLSISQKTSRTYITGQYVDIPITSAISAGTYSIYAKITDGVALEEGKTLSKYLENAVEVVGVTPQFSDFAIDDYSKV